MVNLELSEEYITLVKERFLDTAPETFDEFQAIIVKFREESEAMPMDISTLFSKVKNLFAKHTVDMFKGFLHNLDNNRASSSVELNVVEQEIENQCSMENSRTNFTKRVIRVLNDEDKQSFFMMMIGFHLHKDVERLGREGFDLFKEHPELEIEFSMFLAEAIDQGILARDLVENRKMKQAQDPIDRDNRLWSQVESQEFEIEDGLFERELVYHLIVCAIEDANRLFLYNVETKPLNEWFGDEDYFRGLNEKFMGDELKILDKCRLLSAKPMERGWDLSECDKFIRLMESEIAILSKDWDDEKEEYLRMSRERDLEIPVFDWQAVQSFFRC